MKIYLMGVVDFVHVHQPFGIFWVVRKTEPTIAPRLYIHMN